jgi:TnpA family transposase
VAADTAADSDLIHGLFRLLGYQFSPAGPTCPGMADLTGGHNWRLDRHADYGPLNRLAVYRINWAENLESDPHRGAAHVGVIILRVHL